MEKDDQERLAKALGASRSIPGYSNPKAPGPPPRPTPDAAGGNEKTIEERHYPVKINSVGGRDLFSIELTQKRVSGSLLSIPGVVEALRAALPPEWTLIVESEAPQPADSPIDNHDLDKWIEYLSRPNCIIGKDNIPDFLAMAKEAKAARRPPDSPVPATPAPSHASGWIGVDFDGTLAHYIGWKGHEFDHIGPPIPAMLERINKWLLEGRQVKIFTARAGIPEQIPAVRQWLEAHGLGALEITNIKDRFMYQLWDDRAIQVEINTGREICDAAPADVGHPAPSQAEIEKRWDALGMAMEGDPTPFQAPENPTRSLDIIPTTFEIPPGFVRLSVGARKQPGDRWLNRICNPAIGEWGWSPHIPSGTEWNSIVEVEKPMIRPAPQAPERPEVEKLREAANKAVDAWGRWSVLDDLSPTTAWLDAMDELEAAVAARPPPPEAAAEKGGAT